MENSPFFELEVESAVEPTHVLSALEVYNWGPFRGMHRAEIDPLGTAIIGPTGSGKTTLIDGLMTLLVAQPRYNLASTGGHESDRTLISYVRGVLGGDGANEREEVARPGKTLTGICATYRGGAPELKLGAILWTDRSSDSAQDLKRRWIFCRSEGESLERWLRLLSDDGARDLTRHGRETAQLRIFDSKKSYLAHARKFFDVGENAFTLLNRAAGLKQLNSIDEIFRDLVLDDRSAFDRAMEVAGEFDTLAGIHAELETARRQQAALEPVAAENGKLERARIRAERWRTLKRILPVWFAVVSRQRWAEVVERHDESHRQKTVLYNEATERAKDKEARAGTLQEKYLALGGNVIAELENTIEVQQDRVALRRKNSELYLQLIAPFELSAGLNAEALRANQGVLSERRIEVVAEREKCYREALSADSALRDEENQRKNLEQEIAKVRARPGSNIPPPFQDFRAALADQLTLSEGDLPFVAELVAVKGEESSWRGAIERAIGSERLRVLVPENRLDAALRWVNNRENRLHVRLQNVSVGVQHREFFSDGFTRKLNFKEHSYRSTVMDLLAKRDRHCVDSPEALRGTDHGMTRAGLMSDRSGRFEKQDQRSLHEGWMTGFDNRDQLATLTTALVTIRAAVQECVTTAERLQRTLRDLDSRIKAIESVVELEFSTIDLLGAEAELVRSTDRRDALLDPESDTNKAKEEFGAARRELDEIKAVASELDKELAVIGSKRDDAEAKRDEAGRRAGEGLSEEDGAVSERYLAIPPEMTAIQLEAEEREASKRIAEKSETAEARVADREKRLIRFMEAAQREDTGALVDTGSDLTDVPDYLARLDVLNREALPEKLGSFLAYLNQSSDQGVTQLLSGITEEVDGIEQRIRDLNRTLARVDFRSGRYLQLQPRRIGNERLRSLDSAQRHLRSAALKDDQGESQYRALRAVIAILREAGENRRQQGSLALLDPRFRLQFFVVEVDRKTGAQSQPRTGSQSGSGGEKELMASHILTASLSYALCPAGSDRPLYGTVVLDEAFSKSSPSAAGRIIEALRIFGLHPIFVTPNKEIGLLKKHTRKAICVQRPHREASLASISWEELERMVSSS